MLLCLTETNKLIIVLQN